MKWADVVGFEGVYEVSDCGQVRRILKHGTKELTAYPTGTRLSVHLRFKAGGKIEYKLVHRLVMAAFVGPCPDRQEVNHKDGNPSNNRLDNLEYVSREENMRHAQAHGLMHHVIGAANKSSKLTEEAVAEIRTSNLSGVELAKKYGVVKSVISAARLGVTWQHVQTAPAENLAHQVTGIQNPMAKLTEADVRAIRASAEGCIVLGKRYGISFSTAAKIRRGDSWKHVT